MGQYNYYMFQLHMNKYVLVPSLKHSLIYQNTVMLVKYFFVLLIFQFLYVINQYDNQYFVLFIRPIIKLILIYHNLKYFVFFKELIKKTDYIVGYPIYYRKVYYFYIYGNTNKYVNSFLNPNKVIHISTLIAKNKIDYFFPTELANIIIN